MKNKAYRRLLDEFTIYPDARLRLRQTIMLINYISSLWELRDLLEPL